MGFVIRGLSAEPFLHLYGLSDTELTVYGVKRYACDEPNCYPDRIEMRDAEPGETLLLLNHTSMAKNSPYKASHAIFVREGAEKNYEASDVVPPVMYNRTLSLRAFDSNGMIVDAEIAQGEAIKPTIQKLLANEQVEHIDAHNAAQGCFSGRIVRG